MLLGVLDIGSNSAQLQVPSCPGPSPLGTWRPGFRASPPSASGTRRS